MSNTNFSKNPWANKGLPATRLRNYDPTHRRPPAPTGGLPWWKRGGLTGRRA